MNRGFNVYFKEGFISARRTLRKKDNFIKFYTLALMYLILSVFILPIPMFKMAYSRLGKKVRYENNFDVVDLFKSTNNRNCYRNALVAYVIAFFQVLAKIIVIGSIGSASWFAGYMITQYFAGQVQSTFLIVMTILLPILFALPSVVWLIVVLVKETYNYAALAYIFDSYNDSSATDALKSSRFTLKYDGKRTLFLLAFIPFLIFLVCLAAGTGAVIGLLYLPDVPRTAFIVGIVLIFLLLWFLPYLVLTYQEGKACLFRDLIQDINSKNSFDLVKHKKHEEDYYEEDHNLLEIFNDARDVSLDNDESLASIFSNDNKPLDNNVDNHDEEVETPTTSVEEIKPVEQASQANDINSNEINDTRNRTDDTNNDVISFDEEDSEEANNDVISFDEESSDDEDDEFNQYANSLRSKKGEGE